MRHWRIKRMVLWWIIVGIFIIAVYLMMILLGVQPIDWRSIPLIVWTQHG